MGEFLMGNEQPTSRAMRRSRELNTLAPSTTECVNRDRASFTVLKDVASATTVVTAAAKGIEPWSVREL
jgi:hypothetical protein